MNVVAALRPALLPVIGDVAFLKNASEVMHIIYHLLHLGQCCIEQGQHLCKGPLYNVWETQEEKEAEDQQFCGLP